MASSSEENYSINNFVFRQGSPAKYLYIVYSGEFEVLLLQNQKAKLINPVNVQNYKIVENMEQDHIKKYLGPQSGMRNLHADKVQKYVQKLDEQN